MAVCLQKLFVVLFFTFFRGQMSSSKSSNYKEFKSVSYFRLLKYARPYWFRLFIGIIAGFLVGGSLFSSLIVLPKMMMIMDQDQGSKEKLELTAERILQDINEHPDLSQEQKLAMVKE